MPGRADHIGQAHGYKLRLDSITQVQTNQKSQVYKLVYIPKPRKELNT